MKTYSFEEVKDKYLGRSGTDERDAYENVLRLALFGEENGESARSEQVFKGVRKWRNG